MSDGTVRVVKGENGKYKVLVNFIQQGIEYSNESLARLEANKIIDRRVEAAMSRMG